jgi:hypothetical protein
MLMIFAPKLKEKKPQVMAMFSFKMMRFPIKVAIT